MCCLVLQCQWWCLAPCDCVDPVVTLCTHIMSLCCFSVIMLSGSVCCLFQCDYAVCFSVIMLSL